MYRNIQVKMLLALKCKEQAIVVWTQRTFGKDAHATHANAPQGGSKMAGDRKMMEICWHLSSFPSLLWHNINMSTRQRADPGDTENAGKLNASDSTVPLFHNMQSSQRPRVTLGAVDPRPPLTPSATHLWVLITLWNRFPPAMRDNIYREDVDCYIFWKVNSSLLLLPTGHAGCLWTRQILGGIL